MSVSVRPPSVESRFRIIITSLTALQAVAHLYEETAGSARPPAPPLVGESLPGTSDRPFVSWTALMTASIREQVDAITAVLPERCINLEAPAVDRGEQ